MIRIKDIVKITDSNIENFTGIVTNIWNDGSKLNYKICTRSNEYWYTSNEFQLATDEDVRKEFVEILSLKSSHSKELQNI